MPVLYLGHVFRVFACRELREAMAEGASGDANGLSLENCPVLQFFWNSGDKCANADGTLAKILYKCNILELCQRRRMLALKAYNNHSTYIVYLLYRIKLICVTSYISGAICSGLNFKLRNPQPCLYVGEAIKIRKHQRAP